MIRWLPLLALVGCAPDVFNRKSMACSADDTLKYTNTDVSLTFVQPEVPEEDDGCYLHAEGLRGGSFDRVNDGEIEALDIREITTEGPLPDLELDFDRDGTIELLLGEAELRFASAGRGSMTRTGTTVVLTGDRASLGVGNGEVVDTDGPVFVETHLDAATNWDLMGSAAGGASRVELEGNGTGRFQDALPRLTVTDASVYVACAGCTTRIEVGDGSALEIDGIPAPGWILCVDGKIEYDGPPLIGVAIYLASDEAEIDRRIGGKIEADDSSTWPEGGMTTVGSCPDS